MNIHYEGSLTKEEFKDFVKLASRPVSRKLGFILDPWIMLLLSGLITIAIGVQTLFNSENIGAGTVWAAIGAVLIFFSIKIRKAVDQAWDKYQKGDPHREGNITDNYLEVRFSTGNSQVFWAGFRGYGEYRNILVLFQDNIGFPLSARFFQTEADWQEFKKFVSGKLPVTYRTSSGFINSSNWLTCLLLIISAVTMVVIAVIESQK